ncbi:DUF6252 family protein [Mesonia sp. MT50]|uniref:DUF6252 family protein n=1 Tax=Mesonia profundi TaxID=3070998 RepID=A0ABU0ZXS3_9FLAO|nr:DUF6252 family protein [Mesonia profundi]MDQ7916268.1 DUF6252 family protein [Mesonia profundi]
MRNSFLLALLSLFMMSCGDDVETNTPSIQGEVEDVFFRSSTSTAAINDDGSVTLTGTSSDETVTLKVSDYEVGTYMIQGNAANEATFEDFNGVLYLTGEDGEGKIEVTRVENGTLSGEFYFNALKNGVGDTINFSKGSFFDVPVTNPTPPDPDLNCEEAQAISLSAKIAYDNVDPNNAEELQATCNSYRTALNQEIEACGDESGELQLILDGLGDCEN